MIYSKREIVKTALEGNKPAYVPWAVGFTEEAADKLIEYYSNDDLNAVLDNHLSIMGNMNGFYEEVATDKVRDVFGVTWDRSVDKDIGIVEGTLLPEPTLKNYNFPDPLQKKLFEDIPEKLVTYSDTLRIFHIGFSLYERAWSLRGMQNLLMDFYDKPEFVRELLNTIADYNITQIKKALEYDIDAVYFGDDWGQQHGLQMGYPLWKEFIYPVLKRMYGIVREHGKYVLIHSCGDVAELFDDLVDIGLTCFNPFQPEVMDVYSLMKKYKKKLSFHGGLSTQETLPYGTVDDVRDETKKLLEYGSDGNYIFAPAHVVEGDVPVENMVAFIELLHAQENYRR